MQLIITKSTDSNFLHVVELPDDADLGMLLQLLQSDLNISMQNIQLDCDGTTLQLGPLTSQGVIDGTTLNLNINATTNAGSSAAAATTATANHSDMVPNPTASPAPSTATIPSLEGLTYTQFLGLKPELVMESANASESVMRQVRSVDKELASHCEGRDVSKVRLWMMKKMMNLHMETYEKQQEMIALQTADPMDPEVQKKIEAKIREENIKENLANAMENHPEAFTRVTMLYVPIQVNGVPVKAFVDSGAQVTIMSKRLAEQCGIWRLVDTNFASQMRGVGSNMSLGRIHAAQLRFGNTFVIVSITVMEGNDVDFLFGLDNLRRLRGVIDLERNVLVLDGATDSGREEVSFLGDGEVPQNMFAGKESPDDENVDENTKDQKESGDATGTSSMDVSGSGGSS